MVDGNLFSLIISGSPTDPNQLQAAWSNILLEYSEAIGDSEYRLYVSLYREISLLQNEYKSIGFSIDTLRSIQRYIVAKLYLVGSDMFLYQKRLEDKLNSLLKIACKFNNKDNPTYNAELDKCHRRSKAVKIKLDLKLLAFEAIEKKNRDKGKGIKMDRMYFDSILITISDHAKYEINENITVSKYCERIKRYNQYCESLKSSAK